MSDAPLCSIIVSDLNQASTLRVTLDSIFSQEQQALECFVITANDDTIQMLRASETRGLRWERASATTRVDVTNRAFANARGELVWWLSGADKLCPWATRLASFVFQNLPQVQWLTSGTPLTWTPTQLAVSTGLADGYTARAFYAGRNLQTSAYFHFPIWRAGTVWRRSLWEKCSAQIKSELAEAGDFELWARFFQHSDLHTMNIPLAGQQTNASPIETQTYWQHATQHLNRYRRPAAPSKLVRRAQAQLMRRIPSLRERFAQPAPHVWISPPTLECGIGKHYIL